MEFEENIITSIKPLLEYKNTIKMFKFEKRNIYKKELLPNCILNVGVIFTKRDCYLIVY